MAKGQFLFNAVAEGYARQPIADPASYERKLEITRKYLQPQHRVFEFGCGTGSTALLHAPYVSHILATDYARKMIAIGNRKKDEQNIENVDFAVADIRTQELDAAQFDVILGLNILHLMEDVNLPIQKCWELLKPGGYFISSSICSPRPEGIWRVLLPIMSFVGLFPDIQGFSREELIASHRAAGFEIVEEFDPPGKISSVFLVAQKPGD